MINFKVGLSNKSYVFKINNLFVKNIEELAEEINVQTKIQSTFTISKKHIGKLYIWDWKMNQDRKNFPMMVYRKYCWNLLKMREINSSKFTNIDK